jgi:hypothetical protein
VQELVLEGLVAGALLAAGGALAREQPNGGAVSAHQGDARHDDE